MQVLKYQCLAQLLSPRNLALLKESVNYSFWTQLKVKI